MNLNKYDRVNQHGAELCHAYGCRKHKRLHPAHNGLWCAEHHREIVSLRQVITPHEGSKQEFEARLEELRLRKFTDEGHWKFASYLEKSVHKNQDVSNPPQPCQPNSYVPADHVRDPDL